MNTIKKWLVKRRIKMFNWLSKLIEEALSVVLIVLCLLLAIPILAIIFVGAAILSTAVFWVPVVVIILICKAIGCGG